MVFLNTGCGVNVAQLPEINHPYVAAMEFLKEVKNEEGKAKKTRFEKNEVLSPFDFYLEIREIEDEGTVTVVFYSEVLPDEKDALTAGKEIGKEKIVRANEKKMVKGAERSFYFGESGKYYEYIIFFDTVAELKPGVFHYAIFLRKILLYEGQVEIH